MTEQEKQDIDQPSPVTRNDAQTTAFSDEIRVPGDRLRTSANWDLRDELSEATAYRIAIDPILDREDFDFEELEAAEQELRTRFGPRRDEHALSQKEIDEISVRFAFNGDDVYALSKRLALLLDPVETPFTVKLPRQVAINRAQVEIGSARNLIMSASELLIQALQLVEGLDATQANDRDGAEKFVQLRKDHEDVLLQIEALHRKYGIIATRRNSVLDLRPEHKSRIADERRQEVLFALFEFWCGAGRSLTTTTDPKKKNPRQGPLYDFVKAIVSCVTSPSIKLSGHTIFDDLKNFKASIGLTKYSGP